MNLKVKFIAGGLGPFRGRAASCKPAVVYVERFDRADTHPSSPIFGKIVISFPFEFRILRCRV